MSHAAVSNKRSLTVCIALNDLITPKFNMNIENELWQIQIVQNKIYGLVYTAAGFYYLFSAVQSSVTGIICEVVTL